MDKLQQVEKIYKEIAEDDKKLYEDFLSISAETKTWVLKFSLIRRR